MSSGKGDGDKMGKDDGSKTGTQSQIVPPIKTQTLYNKLGKNPEMDPLIEELQVDKNVPEIKKLWKIMYSLRTKLGINYDKKTSWEFQQGLARTSFADIALLVTSMAKEKMQMMERERDNEEELRELQERMETLEQDDMASSLNKTQNDLQELKEKMEREDPEKYKSIIQEKLLAIAKLEGTLEENNRSMDRQVATMKEQITDYRGELKELNQRYIDDIKNQNEQLMGTVAEIRAGMEEAYSEKAQELKINYETSIQEIRKERESIQMGKQLDIKEMEEKIKNLLQNRAEPVKEKDLFSEVTKRRLESKQRPQEFKLFIRPKKEEEIQVTLDKIKEILNAALDGIKIRRISKTNKAEIRIDTDTKEDLEQIEEKLTEQEEIKENYEIYRPIKINPRIIVFNTPSNLSKEEIYDKIKNQNQEVPQLQDSVVEFPLRGMRGIHWVLSVPPVTFYHLECRRTLYLGFERVTLREFNNVRQCNKCGKLGHTVKVCKMERPNCLRCGETEHLSGESTLCKISCINCRYSNAKFNTRHGEEHDCRSKTCPNYLRQLKLNSQNIDYGGYN